MDKGKRRGGRQKAPEYTPPENLDLVEAEAALRKAEAMVRDVERQIWNSETLFLERQDPRANVLTGYEGMLVSSPAIVRDGPIKPEERVFSQTSVTGSLEPAS